MQYQTGGIRSAMSSNDKNCNLSGAVPNSMQHTSQTQPQLMQPIQMHYPNMNPIGHQLYFRPLALYNTSTRILTPINAEPTVNLPYIQQLQYVIVPPGFMTTLCPTINNNLQPSTKNTAHVENSSIEQPSGQASKQVSVPPVPPESSNQVCSTTKTKIEEATADSTTSTPPTCITQTCTQAPAPQSYTTSILIKPLLKTNKTGKCKNTRCQSPNCLADSDQRRYPDGSPKYSCHVADHRRVFNQPSLLKKPLRCYPGKKTVFCAHCDKGYTRKSQLRVHVKSHENPEPIGELKDGNKIKGPDEKLLYRLPYCERAFGDTSSLKKHEAWHSGDKNTCVKESSEKNELTREKTMRTNVDRRKSKGKRAKGQTQKRRVTRIFTGCGRVFTSVSNLNAHLRLHNNEEKKFTFECYLRKHQQNHRGKKI